jgi:hypothetical protein
MDQTLDSLKSHKTTTTDYLIMLNQLKSKINFGNDTYSLQIEFTWKDSLKNDNHTSYNVNLEYYSAMFNLAVIYRQIGKCYFGANEDGKLKEGIKSFQYAAWLFDKIKNEIPSFIPVKEINPDLSSTFLSYVKFKNN